MSRASKNANAVVKSVTDLLAAHKIWHIRVQTGGLMGAKRFIRFGKEGAGDILAAPRVMRIPSRNKFTGEPEQALWIDGKPSMVWVEAKSGTGRQSPAQKEFQAEVEAAGHSYIIAHDGPEAVIAWLRDHGVIR